MAYDRLRTKLTKENLWLYILRMLMEHPMYAYEINKNLQDRFGFSTATITVYVVLYKMLFEGLVQIKQEEPVIGRPNRKYYEITEKGTKSLEMGIEFLEKTIKKLT